MPSMTTTTQAPKELGEIRPRVMGFEFDDSIPRHWVAGAAVPTAMGNALHLIFPMGERFFVRAVKHYADRIDDPQLRAQIKGFYAQEGRHAHEDERLAREMDAIWFMHSGRVVAAGPPAAVLDGEGAGAGFFAQREAA